MSVEGEPDVIGDLLADAYAQHAAGDEIGATDRFAGTVDDWLEMGESRAVAALLERVDPARVPLAALTGALCSTVWAHRNAVRLVPHKAFLEKVLRTMRADPNISEERVARVAARFSS